MKLRRSSPAHPGSLTRAAVRLSPVPLDLVLVHDESASMWLVDPGLVAQRQAARRVVSIARARLGGAADRIGYVGFGSPHLDEVVSLRPIARRGDRRAFVDRIRAAFHRGWPDYEAALLAAADALQDGDDAYAMPPYRATGRAVGALLVSEGRPRVGADPVVAPRRSPRYRPGTDLFRKRRWPVHTIDVGTAAGDGEAACALRAIAESTGGRHHQAPAPDDLVRVYVDIVAELGRRRRTTRPGPPRDPGRDPAAGRKAREAREKARERPGV
jgi:hypothetical protein